MFFRRGKSETSPDLFSGVTIASDGFIRKFVSETHLFPEMKQISR
jgi:hypothetical protein